MTQLTITPKVADKTARFKGTIAAGEHVAVTIKGGAEWIGTDNGANLTLRVLDLVTGRTLAVFPRPEEVLEENEEADEWAVSEEDAGDLTCTLNLNTLRMVAAARHMLRVPVMFVLGDTDDPRTLYFRDRYEVVYWPERIGDTVPYDLDKWPKQIDEWTELVEGFGTRLDAAEEDIAAKGEAIDEAIDSIDGKVSDAVSTHLAGKKDVQTAVEDPDASGTSLTFIDTISQDTNGEIMPTKKGVKIDDVPTANSGNPVKSGGVKTALDAKYVKPQNGIPKTDLASAVQASLGKADTALQAHQDLSEYVNGVVYDQNVNSIKFKHDTKVLFEIDVTAFIKDGMVDSVEISGGNLVISFNTDAGIENIEIPLTDIFNPSNYYDKTAADGRFVQKEAGKGLVAVDATLTTQGAAADARAVGDALRGGFTEWVCDPSDITMVFEDNHWVPYFDGMPQGSSKGDADSLSLSWTFGVDASEDISATRHLVTPTKTSQLTNDGDGTNAFVKTNDSRLSDSRTPTAHHATHAANGSDPLAPADIGAAAASDLPYRLVEPGKWEFSEPQGLTNFAVTLIEYDNGYWTLYYTSDETTSDSTSSAGNETDLSVTFYVGASGESVVTATRASLPGHILDRAGNRVVVSGDTTLTLPAAVPGHLRDFLVRLEISGSTVPTITFAAPTGETITYETDGDEFPVPDEAGDWLYSFTESCVAHKFAVSLKKVQTVTQGGS